jgi:serine/threonine protein kinase
MSVPNTAEEVIQLIRKSGMIDEQKLQEYLQRRELTRGLPDDPREFCDELVRDGIVTYFQAEQFMLGKWRGFTIGKYKLLERVGVGGMGQVFLCEHMFMKKRVAVKVLPPAKAEQPAALGRFYREARAAGSLAHPNIIRTHDIDQDGNLHFIVMDYINGSNLLDTVKKFGPMDVGRATSHIKQVADALDYAFRSGIIHRDVKPGNVLVDHRGQAHVLDMGLARFFKDHTDQLTIKYDDKIVLGTADYVAPEQVANSHAVDIRADIYALGATFYFLLAGHPPFPTGTVSQKLLWHRTKEPTPIRQVRPEVPEELAQILARMMAKEPKARYQTPAQVAAELAAWVPAEVPLPASEELPNLSPAVTELLADEIAPAEEIAAPKSVPAAAVSAAAAAPARASGVTAVAEARPAPFAPAAADPWAAAPPPPAPVVLTKSKPVQAAIDTVAAEGQPTPTRTHRPTPFSGTNPFTGGDAPLTQKGPPWGAIGVVAAAAAAGLALAVFKVLG